MIRIDGNYGEGGGAIARIALALSTITQKPFEIYDIRKGRKDAGLKNQHLYCVKSLQELCNADAEGAELGALYLKYYPKKLTAKKLTADGHFFYKKAYAAGCAPKFKVGAHKAYAP